MVPAGCMVCDVGCDHGYVPIYLAERRVCPRIIAMDVREGPLMQAREHIRAFALEEYIETRRSDGVSALGYKEADYLILAGMGGRLAVRILADGREKVARMKGLILQPQSDLVLVRTYLRQQGYEIVQENMVHEDGKFYTVMKAVFCITGQQCSGSMERDTMAGKAGPSQSQAAAEGTEMSDKGLLRQAYDRYGPCLLHNRHPVLYEFLQWEEEREAAIRHRILTEAREEGGAGCRRLEELTVSARIRAAALSCYTCVHPEKGMTGLPWDSERKCTDAVQGIDGKAGNDMAFIPCGELG